MPDGFGLPQIPEDPKERQEIISKANRKLGYARRYFQRWHERWVRYYKIWRSLLEAVDDIEDQDEPNSFIPYVFGMIEDMSSKITAPLLKMKPPARVKPRKPGQQPQAQNFSTMARNYFSSPDYQTGFIASMKECQITGTRWEYDVFDNNWREGVRWAKVKVPKLLRSLIELGGKLIPTAVTALVEDWKLVKDRHPVSVGYKCRFPSTFHVHPQPGIKLEEFQSKAEWAILEEVNVSIESLQSQTFQDPSTGEIKPVYDLELLLKEEKGGNSKKVIVATTHVEGTDYYGEALAAISGNSSADHGFGDNMDEGIDKIHLYHVFYKDGRVESIGQGKYLVRVSQLPLAQIPLRPTCYTIDPQFLHGIGMIEPIEDLVYELNDSHNLAMSNWLRIINRMLVVDMSKIDNKDDLQPKPGQVVRITGGDARAAVASPTTPDITGSMLAMESNAKGIMERSAAAADFSEGVAGTKQSHDTLGGIQEIARNMDVRIGTVMGYQTSNYVKQMHVMEKYTSFYHFTPMPFEKFADDGSTMTVELSNDDIYTEGKGFYYVIEHDPSYGNDVVRRQQLFVYLESMYKYDEWVRAFGGPQDARPNIPNIMKMISTNFGFEDTSNVLIQKGGAMDPGKELEIFMAGGKVQPKPDEGLMYHFMKHLADRNSQTFLEAVESGKIRPENVTAFDEHIAQTNEMILAVMKNPAAAAEQLAGGASGGQYSSG
ncbi:hypothetical protein LCGC14_0915000 [marine sediment metagenome]|uniref:Portal protein n=1 Tax=marine sediment metagenome TaxID=412755 RepID=A0A0F9NSH1_9ZZZZ